MKQERKRTRMSEKHTKGKRRIKKGGKEVNNVGMEGRGNRGEATDENITNHLALPRRPREDQKRKILFSCLSQHFSRSSHRAMLPSLERSACTNSTKSFRLNTASCMGASWARTGGVLSATRMREIRPVTTRVRRKQRREKDGNKHSNRYQRNI